MHKLVHNALRVSAIFALSVLFCGLATCADLGRSARYDDASPAAQASNDKLILSFQDALPLDGGILDLREGELHISKPILNPKRWQYPPGSPGWCPINFRIRGNYTNSRIVYHDAALGKRGIAIDFAPTTAAMYRWQDVRLGLEGFILQGGGIKCTGGGKVTDLRNVEVVDHDVGVTLIDFDGGALHNVKSHHGGLGLRMQNCHQVWLDNVHPRENDKGWEVANCGALHGAVNPEGNKGLQCDFDQLQQSNLFVWIEGTGAVGFDKPLAKMSRCEWNNIGGVDQGNGITMDPISRATTRFVNSPTEWPKLGTPVGAPTVFQAYSGTPLFSQDALTMVCNPGCFAQSGILQGEVQGFDNTGTVAWKKGDYLQVSMDVVCDADTIAWCGDKQPILFSMAGGTFPECREQVRITGERTKVRRMLGEAPADGKGVRMFATLLGNKTGVDQPKRLAFKLENVEVRLLRNQ